MNGNSNVTTASATAVKIAGLKMIMEHLCIIVWENMPLNVAFNRHSITFRNMAFNSNISYKYDKCTHDPNYLTVTNESKSFAPSTPTIGRANNFPVPDLIVIAEIQHHYEATVNLRVVLAEYDCYSLSITTQ